METANTIHEITRSTTKQGISFVPFRVFSWIVFFSSLQDPGFGAPQQSEVIEGEDLERLIDITELERVRFVLKGGEVFRNEITR